MLNLELKPETNKWKLLFVNIKGAIVVDKDKLIIFPTDKLQKVLEQ